MFVGNGEKRRVANARKNCRWLVSAKWKRKKKERKKEKEKRHHGSRLLRRR